MTDFLRLRQRISAGPGELEPFFWKVLRAGANDPEKILLDQASKSFDDIYKGVDNRLKELKIRTSLENFPMLLRRVLLRELPSSVLSSWDTLTNTQKDFFRERYFVTPEGDKYCVKMELSDVEKIAVYPDGSGEKLTAENEDYFFSEGYAYFNTDPFTVFEDVTKVRDSSIKARWNRTYDYRELYVYACVGDTTTSPIDDCYGTLVMDETYKSLAEKSLDYAEFIYSFYRVMYQGATPYALQYFVNILAGSPVTEEDGEEVVKITTETVDGDLYNVVYTTRSSYNIPIIIPVASWVTKGAALAANTPLGEYVTIKTYDSDDAWVDGETLGDHLMKVNKTTGSRSNISFDLSSEYSIEDLDLGYITWAQRPRFDINMITKKPGKRFHTATHGVWHRILGPPTVKFEINDYYFPDNMLELFDFILREVMPFDILYSVEKTDFDPSVLLDHLGEAILDWLGDPILGSGGT